MIQDDAGVRSRIGILLRASAERDARPLVRARYPMTASATVRGSAAGSPTQHWKGRSERSYPRSKAYGVASRCGFPKHFLSLQGVDSFASPQYALYRLNNDSVSQENSFTRVGNVSSGWLGATAQTPILPRP